MSKEVITHIFQLLKWLVIRITIIKRLLKKMLENATQMANKRTYPDFSHA